MHSVNYANGKPIKAETLIGDIRRESEIQLHFLTSADGRNTLAIMSWKCGHFLLKGWGGKLMLQLPSPGNYR